MIITAIPRKLLLVGALTCLSTLNPGHVMSNETQDTPVRYYLSVRASHVSALIRVNDIPLIEDTAEAGLATTEPVHGWLMSGENTLGIELRPASDSGTEPSVEIKLYLHEPQAEIPTPKTVLAEFHYPNPKATLPLKQTLAFNVTEPLPTRLWAEAETLAELSDDDKTHIIALANRLQNSLLNQNIDEALRLQDYKIKDDALAEGKPVERLQEGARSGLQWMAEQGELSGAPLDNASAVFELCANNRLVYVSRNDGEEAVTLTSEELLFDVPVYAARIKGEWLIVR